MQNLKISQLKQSVNLFNFQLSLETLAVQENCYHWSSLFHNTSARHEWHECDTSDISATQVQHERQERDTIDTKTTRVRTCATQTTRVWHEGKKLFLITRRVKTYFPTPILAMWLMKDYKERNNLTLRTTFWICIVPSLKCLWKLHQKNWNL